MILSAEVALDLPAEVILRTNEMVLDIPHHRDWNGPYLILGSLVGSFYAGQDELAHEYKVDVVARWAKLGDVFVGIWIEDGHEFLFSFRLPKGKRRD